MQEQEHQQSLYNKYFIYIVIYFILEIRHKSCYIKTWVEQSVACIRSEFKSRATIDPVFKLMSLLSQAYSILTLLFHGLELLSSRPCDLCDLQSVYTELILNIMASYCPTHLCQISVGSLSASTTGFWIGSETTCASNAQKGMGNVVFCILSILKKWEYLNYCLTVRISSTNYP